jgi:D,D-heptose 1,7-bisphosphate phosphatase
VEPAVFLDRDNTIIHNDGDLGDPGLVRIVDDVPRGLKSLHEAGYRLVVVTNQAGVARGKFTEHDVDMVHQRIASVIDEQAHGLGLIDRFYYCPYHPEAVVPEYRRDHPWRKPHPGMLLQAARDMGLDLSPSWLVGDQERDIAAGRAAGCRTVLVSRDPQLAARAGATAVVSDFSQAVEWIVHNQPTPPGSDPGTGPGTSFGTASASNSGGGGRGGHNGISTASSSSPATWSVSSPSAAPAQSPTNAAGDMDRLRRTISDLAEELRSDRQRRAEFTTLTMAAGFSQLLALALAVLGLLQLSNAAAFNQWMLGAVLVQLIAITLVLLDLKS